MMLRPAVSLTDYEDSILFDIDDPDFSPPEYPQGRANSPLPGAHQLRRGSLCNSSGSLTATLEVPASRERQISACSSGCTSFDSDIHYLSIESLRTHLNSCFTCGVSWYDEHVSLDCPECGGYSLKRPCPTCDGLCNAIWKRDLASSHASGKARWEGDCLMKQIAANSDPRHLLLHAITIDTPCTKASS